MYVLWRWSNIFARTEMFSRSSLVKAKSKSNTNPTT